MTWKLWRCTARSFVTSARKGPGAGTRGQWSPASWASPRGPGLAPAGTPPGVEGDLLFSCVNAGVLRHQNEVTEGWHSVTPADPREWHRLGCRT